MSGGCLDRQTEGARGRAHPIVVGDNGPEIGSDQLRRGEMDRVQATQPRSWRERAGAIEQVVAQRDLGDAAKLATGVGNRSGTARQNGTDEFDAGERAGNAEIVPVATKVATQARRLGFPLHELDQCRSVQVQLHRSSSRMAASAADASMP